MKRERLNGQRLVYLNEIAKISLVDGLIYCQVESVVRYSEYPGEYAIFVFKVKRFLCI